MPQTDDLVFYQLYFQSPGVAEAELERDVRGTVRSVLYSISGDALPSDGGIAGTGRVGMVDRQGGFLAGAMSPFLPAWITEADVNFYTAEFTRTGFRGGLNWYRNIDRNWELLAPFSGARDRTGALHRGPSRCCPRIRWRKRCDREPGEIRSTASRDSHIAGLRALDPAGTCR
jgi:hypothetical protein